MVVDLFAHQLLVLLFIADCATPVVPLQGMRVLVDARDKLGIRWQSCENEKEGMLVMSWERRAGAVGIEPDEFQLYVMALSALWADVGIHQAYARRSEFQLVSRVMVSCLWRSSRRCLNTIVHAAIQ